MFDNQSKTTRSKCDHLNATPFGQERHRLETWHRARIVLVNDQNVDEKLRQRHPRFCNSNVNWSIANLTNANLTNAKTYDRKLFEQHPEVYFTDKWKRMMNRRNYRSEWGEYEDLYDAHS